MGKSAATLERTRAGVFVWTAWVAASAGCAGRAGPDKADGGSSAPDGSQSALGEDACASPQTISAACFDQSCVTDLDCVAVGQGSVTLPCEIECPSAAINKSALAAYEATVKRLAPQSESAMCGCPLFGDPCCQKGKCHEVCDDFIVDLDACAASGGTCVMSATPGCVRISYCAANPNIPTTFGVCCPALGGGEGD